MLLHCFDDRNGIFSHLNSKLNFQYIRLCFTWRRKKESHLFVSLKYLRVCVYVSVCAQFVL